MITAALLLVSFQSRLREIPIWLPVVSADGNVVVGSTWKTSDGPTMWTRRGGVQKLGILKNAYGHATDISADGSVIVGWVDQKKKKGYTSFIWTRGKGVQLLAARMANSEPALSPDGKWVTGYMGSAFRWSPRTGIQELPRALADKPHSAATDIANTGLAVGFCDVGPKVQRLPSMGKRIEDGSIEACVWTDPSKITRLGRPDGFFTTQATGCSADGRIVCGFGSTKSGDRPFVWTEQEGLQLLPLPKGVVSCEAYEITPNGRYIFGWSVGAEAGLIWCKDFGAKTVAQYLKDNGVANKGWTLDSITGMSDDGKVLCGGGRDTKGRQISWIADLR